MAVNAHRRATPAAERGVARALSGSEARLAALRDQRVQEHAALLRAARRVFLRRGYRQTRVEDVLHEAGISTRAFYRFHAGKDELFLDLFARANQAAMRRLRETVARHDDPLAQLDAYVEATLDLAYEPRLRRETMLFANVPGELAERHADEIAACREQLVGVLREIVERGRARGVFPAADAEDDAWLVHGALGAAMTRALLPVPPPRARLARGLHRFCRAALGG
ncbi:MAG: TetR/AcrR family transcriptional regulator [Thermodesulfobacteriota bacterium]